MTENITSVSILVWDFAPPHQASILDSQTSAFHGFLENEVLHSHPSLPPAPPCPPCVDFQGQPLLSSLMLLL